MRSKIIVLGIVLVLLASVIGTVSALSNSGGGEWEYYKEITVKENSGRTLMDFQVLVELNSANFDFSKAKSDGSDIRFSTDGEELNYWIEEWDAGAKRAKIWVKVPLIPTNGQTTIKMWYGNPSAVSSSNGNKVFEFFDDFESGVIDTTNKWEPGGTATIVDNPYPIGEDKVLDVSYDHYLYSKNTFPPPFAYRCSGASSFGFSPNIGVVTYQHYDSTSGGTQLFWRAHPTVARPHENAWESAIKYEAHPADWSTAYSPIPPYQYKTWFVGETVVKNRSYHAHYVNGILVKEWTGTMIGNINPGIRVVGGHDQAEQYIDWVFIPRTNPPFFTRIPNHSTNTRTTNRARRQNKSGMALQPRQIRHPHLNDRPQIRRHKHRFPQHRCEQHLEIRAIREIRTREWCRSACDDSRRPEMRIEGEPCKFPQSSRESSGLQR